MIQATAEWIGRDELLGALARGELEIEGRLTRASNATFRCVVEVAPGVEVRCVYKPVRGERPLWDFPDSTLCRREVAAHDLAVALGWPVVPPTAWRDDGPAGPGMCQAWIDEVEEPGQVTIAPAGDLPPGWLEVFQGEDGAGNAVALLHRDTMALRQVALLDAVMNNADRKGGHLLEDADGRVWAIDHGVTFSDEDKLRTVLWGWARQPLPDALLEPLSGVEHREGFDRACAWLAPAEVEALRGRIRRILRQRTFPVPSHDWPSIPWPVF